MARVARSPACCASRVRATASASGRAIRRGRASTPAAAASETSGASARVVLEISAAARRRETAAAAAGASSSALARKRNEKAQPAERGDVVHHLVDAELYALLRVHEVASLEPQREPLVEV